MLTKTALEAFDYNASDLARAIGVTPHAIYQWGEEVPKRRINKIKEAIKAKKQNSPASDFAA